MGAKCSRRRSEAQWELVDSQPNSDSVYDQDWLLNCDDGGRKKPQSYASLKKAADAWDKLGKGITDLSMKNFADPNASSAVWSSLEKDILSSMPAFPLSEQELDSCQDVPHPDSTDLYFLYGRPAPTAIICLRKTIYYVFQNRNVWFCGSPKP